MRSDCQQCQCSSPARAIIAPLRQLRLDHATELYLGLVHVEDGVDGTRRRLAAASKVVPTFGITSECGISRGRDPEVALKFMQVSAEAATGASAQ